MNQAESQELRRQLDSMAERHRVADVLPYQHIGQVGRIDYVQLLDDQSFGIAFQLGVPAVESTIGAEAAIAKVLDQMIRKLPAGYVMQWYRKNSTDVSDFLELYRAQAGNDAAGRAICEAAIDRWTAAIDEGFFPGDSRNFFPCREEFAVMIKAPPEGAFKFTAEQAFALLTNLEAPSPRYVKFAKEFEGAVREIRETASSGGLTIMPMSADGFIPFVVTLLYPRGAKRSTIPTDTGVESLSEAIGAAGEMDLDNGEGKARTDGFCAIRDGKRSYHRAVSMIWPPKAVEAGMCNELMYKEPLLTMVTTVEMLPQLLEGAKLKAQQFLQSKTVTSFNAQEAAEKDSSYKSVARRLFAGEKLCMVRMQAIVSAPTKEGAEDAALRVQSAMDAMFPAAAEDAFGTSLILPGALPFAISAHREKTFKRSRRMLSTDLADLIPAGGRWTGVVPTNEWLSVESNRRKPIVMYSNGVGGPLFVNPHLCEENPHILIAGGSGSGKTFFLHDLLLQTWRIPDVRAYLISIKPDYVRLSHVLGRYLEIDLDKNISLNPLGGKPTNANQAVWATAVCLMITDGDPNERVSKEERVIIEESVMAAAQENWDLETDTPIKETVLQDVVAKLSTQGMQGQRLAQRLRPYYSGPYRNLINRPRTLTKEDRFVFFNLSNVRELSCCAVMMFCLFRFIDDIMYDPRLVGVPKVVVYDEGWAGMDDPASAGLFTKSARAYRSLGGQAVFISQRFGDYDTDLGQAILANTATKIILPQQASELSKLGKYIDLNEREMAAVRSLRLQKRLYGEFFVKMQGLYSTTGRIIPDALKYAIATTDAHDEELYCELLQRAGGDHRDAIADFANNYPYGNPRK